MLSPAISFGIWPALPFSGYWLLTRNDRAYATRLFPPIASLPLMTVAGIVFWSVPMLASGVAGVYHAEFFGALGWAVTLVTVLALIKQGYSLRGFSQKLAGWDWLLLSGLLVASWVYLAFPTESILGDRDMGVYANHGIYLAQHGRLDVPYPFPQEFDSAFRELRSHYQKHYFPGFYWTLPTMTVQFAHLYPVWLAQSFSTFGHHGMFRLNGVFAMLFLPIFYSLCQLAVPKAYAAIATLFIAFNVSQIWLARITLTEILTQLLIWSGLFLLMVALRQSNTRVARWSGVFLGCSSLVRIDSLLLVPFMFLSHLASKIIKETSTERSAPVWAGLYQTALPTFVLAVCYYAFASRPYFDYRSPDLRKLGTVSVASLLLLVAATPGILKRVRPWLTGKTCLILLGLTLTLLTAYAYWIRPKVVGNLTLVNLARYLSPVVIWAALLGWFMTLWLLVRRGRDHHLIGILVISAGFSLLFLWQPFIHPDHFWAIRRFVPAVIPGFVFFASVGTWLIVRRIPKGLARVASALLLMFFSAFTIRADALILFFAENSGYFVQLRQLADKLPSDELLFAHGDVTWMTPLYVAFGRRVVPIHMDSDEGKNGFNDWMLKQFAKQKPVYLLYEGRLNLTGLRHSKVDEVILSRSFSELTTNPLPRRILKEQRTIEIYEITGIDQRPDYQVVALGAQRVWGVDESGFHGQEWSGSRPVRWTNGAAELTVPVDMQRPPKALKVYLDASGPKGTKLQILVNGRKTFDERIPAGSWAKAFSLAGVPLGNRAAIELNSDSFVARETVKGSTDPRTLGVLVRAIRLLERDEAVADKLLSHKGYRSRLRLAPTSEPLNVAEGQRTTVRVTVRNVSQEPWPVLTDVGQEKGSVNLGILWFAQGKPDKRLAEQRSEIPFTLFPGSEVEIVVGLNPIGYDGKRLPPGEYEVWIGPVQEAVTWFYEKGDSVAKVAVTVTP